MNGGGARWTGSSGTSNAAQSVGSRSEQNNSNTSVRRATNTKQEDDFNHMSPTFSTQCKSQAFYQTCLVKSRDSVIRVLYDGASGHSFATSELVRKLELKVEQAKPHAIQVFARNRIKWHFKTPLSPWKGGIFERLIRTVKNCLKSMTLAKRYIFEDLRTIIYEIAQILNSRPLFTANGQIITPAHFTFDKPLTFLPPVGRGGLKGFSSELMDIVQHQHRVNGFWKHWLKSYLMQLPSVWPIGMVRKVQGDEEEKVVSRSIGRLALLEATDQYVSLDPNYSNEAAEDVASDKAAQFKSDRTTSLDGHEEDSSDTGGELDDEM